MGIENKDDTDELWRDQFHISVDLLRGECTYLAS